MNTDSALAQAESLLLMPFSLTEGDLARTFGQILTHQVDYADLYFQYSRSEAWSLDEGIVKSGSFNIDQGVGVRALSGEKTAFAYSDDISSRALGDATIPRLAGQQIPYLQTSLTRYRDKTGVRNNQLMSIATSSLKNDDIKAIANYLTQLP